VLACFTAIKIIQQEGPTDPEKGLSGIQSQVGKVSATIKNKKIDSKWMLLGKPTASKWGYNRRHGNWIDVEESSQIQEVL